MAWQGYGFSLGGMVKVSFLFLCLALDPGLWARTPLILYNRASQKRIVGRFRTIWKGSTFFGSVDEIAGLKFYDVVAVVCGRILDLGAAGVSTYLMSVGVFGERADEICIFRKLFLSVDERCAPEQDVSPCSHIRDCRGYAVVSGSRCYHALGGSLAVVFQFFLSLYDMNTNLLESKLS